MNRRQFLLTTTATGFSQLLAGCSGQTSSGLSVRLLNGSIPPQVLNEFRKTLQRTSKDAVLEFSPEPQLQTLFTLLQTWKQKSSQPNQSTSGLPSWIPWVGDRPSTTPTNLVTLGNYWLQKAIQQGLLKPFDPDWGKDWTQLPQSDQWKALVMRNQQGEPDLKGSVWGAPYRWGTTMIAYRQDIFQERGLQPPKDWSDLWRPELKRQISLLDQPREVIGLTLKKLGQSYNLPDLSVVPNLEMELRALHQQVKLYSSNAYLQPLILGDTWLAVGWSTDILTMMQRNPQIAAVVPQSGTAMWADLWVRPVANPTAMSTLETEWIRFCWQPDIAGQLSLLSRATSPAVLAIPPNALPQELRTDALLLPDAKILKNSEFLQPLSPATMKQYQTLWTNLRRTVV